MRDQIEEHLPVDKVAPLRMQAMAERTPFFNNMTQKCTATHKVEELTSAFSLNTRKWARYEELSGPYYEG